MWVQEDQKENEEETREKMQQNGRKTVCLWLHMPDSKYLTDWYVNQIKFYKWGRNEKLGRGAKDNYDMQKLIGAAILGHKRSFGALACI